MLELKKLSWLFFRISLCMNYSHNIYTLPSISGELRTFTINRWQYKDLSRVSVSKRAVCSYKKKMNTLYGVCFGTWKSFLFRFKHSCTNLFRPKIPFKCDWGFLWIIICQKIQFLTFFQKITFVFTGSNYHYHGQSADT